MLDVNKKTLLRIFIGAGGCIILYWLLNETENVKNVLGAMLNILSPFITGGCIAFILNVPMR
ncbi:MAG: AI-2E family transporter, partial [Firmicutes bacterium]|nr:AI-2E family transporter [Bacillota bacterium]